VSNKHTGYCAYIPDSHNEDANLNLVKAKVETVDKQEYSRETKDSLDEVMKALEVVQDFAIRHWKPCLRDCCGDAMDDVEEKLEQLRKEQE